MEFKVGDIIRIIRSEELSILGRVGKITRIDDMGQIHGTWGGIAVSEEYGDVLEKINE